MPFFQDSLSASSINKEEVIKEQERLKLKALASAPRGSRWIVRNGQFERAGLWQKLTEPVKGWVGFKNATHPTLIEYELIRYLGDGAAHNIFKREDLYLIKLAARQAGLIRGIERSEKNHRDLATLINLIVKQVVQHQHLPAVCYQAYASRFYHNNKGILKPICPPPELSPYQPRIEDESSFSEEDSNSNENPTNASSGNQKLSEEQPTDAKQMPVDSQKKTTAPREKTEWSISIVKDDSKEHSSQASFFERKKFISFVALGLLAAMTLYRYRNECLSMFFHQPLNQVPARNLTPSTYPGVGHPIINNTIPIASVSETANITKTYIQTSESAFPSYAKLGVAGLCTALFAIIIRNCRGSLRQAEAPLLPFHAPAPPLIAQSPQQPSQSKLMSSVAIQMPVEIDDGEQQDDNHGPSESWDPEVVINNVSESEQRKALANISIPIEDDPDNNNSGYGIENGANRTLTNGSDYPRLLSPLLTHTITSLAAQSSNIVSGKKILSDEEIPIYNRRPVKNIAEKLEKIFKTANKDKYLYANHNDTWDSAPWTFDNEKKANGERNKKAVTYGDRIYANFDNERKYIDKLGEHVGLAYGQGVRKEMEDAHLVKELEINGKRHLLFAIFDGHGGDSCSAYLQAFLHTYLEENLPKALAASNREEAIGEMLTLAFVHLGKDYRDDLELLKEQGIVPEGKIKFGGSTATVVLVVDGILYTANAGDTRAIISTPDSVIALSRDAKPGIKKFTRGAEKRGGHVLFDTKGTQRVHKNETFLAVARAVGHDEVESAINPRAEVTKFKLSNLSNQSDNYLVIACDGLWDVASSYQVSKTIQEFAKEGSPKSSKPSPSGMAARLVSKAFNNGSKDNVSVMIVDISYLTNPPKK